MRDVCCKKTVVGHMSDDTRKVSSDSSLKALLLREVLGINTPELVEAALSASDPLSVAYAVQLAGADTASRQRHLSALQKLASKPQPANVLLALVSVAQKYESPGRWQLAAAILGCPENEKTIAGELNLTLMTWYAIEPVVLEPSALDLLTGNAKLLHFAVRRRAHAVDSHPN